MTIKTVTFARTNPTDWTFAPENSNSNIRNIDEIDNETQRAELFHGDRDKLLLNETDVCHNSRHNAFLANSNNYNFSHNHRNNNNHNNQNALLQKLLLANRINNKNKKMGKKDENQSNNMTYVLQMMNPAHKRNTTKNNWKKIFASTFLIISTLFLIDLGLGYYLDGFRPIFEAIHELWHRITDQFYRSFKVRGMRDEDLNKICHIFLGICLSVFIIFFTIITVMIKNRFTECCKILIRSCQNRRLAKKLRRVKRIEYERLMLEFPCLQLTYKEWLREQEAVNSAGEGETDAETNSDAETEKGLKKKQLQRNVTKNQSIIMD